jgi:hypothetical protein
LETERVTRDLPVTIDLSNLSLGHALDKLLSQIGGVYAHLGYEIDQGVVTISTSQDFAKDVIAIVYDIKAPAKDLEAIKRRISGIDPLSWKTAGGIAEIDEFQSQLVITQTREIHARIAAELKDVLSAEESHFPF